MKWIQYAMDLNCVIYYNVIVQSFPRENLPLDVSTRRDIYAHRLLITVMPPPIKVGESFSSYKPKRAMIVST